jgi:hypothetical protein
MTYGEMQILYTSMKFFLAEQPLTGQPVQHALCRFYHITNHALPARLCLPAKQGKTPIRVGPLSYGLRVPSYSLPFFHGPFPAFLPATEHFSSA